MYFQRILIFNLVIKLVAFFPAIGHAQSKDTTSIENLAYRLEIIALKDSAILKTLNYQKIFKNISDRDKEIKNVLNYCFDKAYLTASCDSSTGTINYKKAYLSLGTNYLWANLSSGNVDESVLNEIGFREKLYHHKAIYYKEIRLIQEKIITYYENNGYPFANIKLDNIIIKNGEISAQLNLSKESEEKIDSVLIKGPAKISTIYIYNYLKIKPGNLYNESQLKQVNTRLAEIPFIKSYKPANILFNNDFNKLILYLDTKQASAFNGIIGILPNNKTGEINVTGDVSLKLQNGLGRGELIDLNWRRLQTQTQDLKLRLVYPFLLRSPFGLDYNFKLYKRDTSFLDINQTFGLQYIFIGANYFKIFYNNKVSNILSSKGLEQLTTLPANADIQNNMYGIGIKYEELDYRLNPQKGFYINGNISVGTKTIKKNIALNPIVYDKLKLNSTQYNAELEACLYLSLIDRSTLKLGIQSGFIYGESIFQNELFRIGGLKALRGFDEESIFASSFAIFTIEYRYLLEQNSYLYLFSDGAYYEKNNNKSYINDTPISFGAGISFETKAGIFSINYALGKQFDNQFQVKSGKIHFGIVNYF